MSKKRIAYIDLVKLFTIYLVILGHVVSLMVNGYAIGARLSDFIYSFHMPLFMLLSGLFVNSSIHASFVPFFIRKAKQLMLPAFTCTLIVCIYLFFFKDSPDYRVEIIGNSWFLKTLFIYYVLFYMIKKVKCNDWLLMFLSCTILFLIPKGTTLQINHLFPYFWGGYLLNKYQCLDKIASTWKYAVFFTIVYVGFYYLQRYNHIPNYIPINIETIPGQWHLILLRFVVAFSGSMCTISLIAIVYRHIRNWKQTSLMAECGQKTLGVYVLQTILVANIFPDTLSWYVESELLLDAVVGPFLSFMFLALCLWLIRILSKNKTLNLLLFGGQYNKKKNECLYDNDNDSGIGKHPGYFRTALPSDGGA